MPPGDRQPLDAPVTAAPSQRSHHGSSSTAVFSVWLHQYSTGLLLYSQSTAGNCIPNLKNTKATSHDRYWSGCARSTVMGTCRRVAPAGHSCAGVLLEMSNLQPCPRDPTQRLGENESHILMGQPWAGRPCSPIIHLTAVSAQASLPSPRFLCLPGFIAHLLDQLHLR